MPDADNAPGERWLRLGGEYDPGQFVFDYFNDPQLSDLAQSLGLDLATSRQITREKHASGNLKATIKVVEVSGGAGGSTAEAVAHTGPLQTATLLEVLVRLREQVRLFILSEPRVDGPTGMLAACDAAAHERGWIVVEGFWRVQAEPLALQLIRVSEDADALDDHRLTIGIEVPARTAELTPTGRRRLGSDRVIRADVFAQTEHWSKDDQEFIAIAHAVFARLGDPRFGWHGASFGDNSNGDF
jgi:hypothetical protein